jgi:hypothetical protein
MGGSNRKRKRESKSSQKRRDYSFDILGMTLVSVNEAVK